jgi:hypothetical protein
MGDRDREPCPWCGDIAAREQRECYRIAIREAARMISAGIIGPAVKLLEGLADPAPEPPRE